MVKGAVPGSKGGWVTIKDATKKPAFTDSPFPAALRSQPENASVTIEPESIQQDDNSGSEN